MLRFIIGLMLVAAPAWTGIVANDDVDRYAYPDLVIPQESPSSLEQIKEVFEQNSQYFHDVEIINNTHYPGMKTLFFRFLQHLDPSEGEEDVCFYQRAVITNYTGPDAVTVMNTNGYDLDVSEDFHVDDIALELNANYLAVEHRYHGESLPPASSYAPEGPLTSENYWSKCRAVYASHDLCTLVNTLKKLRIFTGKWLSTGTSKNGMTTTFLAMHYPNTCDAYLPFCAPFCKSMEDPIMDVIHYKYSGFLEEEDKLTGQNSAEVWQRSCDLLTDILSNPQLLQRMMDIQRDLWERPSMPDAEACFRVVLSYMDSQWTRAIYLHVSDWARYLPARVAPDQEITDDLLRDIYTFIYISYYEIIEERNKQARALVRNFINLQDTQDADSRHRAPGEPPTKSILSADPYDVQCMIELGHYAFSLPSQIKEAVEKAGYSYDELIRRWNTFNFKPYTTLRQYYPFTPIEPEVKEFVKTTHCQILFVYGQYDPWTSAGIQDSDIPASQTNVQRILVPAGVHSNRVSSGAYYSPLDPSIGQTIIEKTRNMLGLPTGINGLASAPSPHGGQIYNLAGQRVGTGYRGLVIRNGRKVYQR